MNASVRICLIVEIFHPEDHGGQGRQAHALAEALIDRGCAVEVITRKHVLDQTRDVVGRVPVRRLSPRGVFKGAGWRAFGPMLHFLASLAWELLRTAGRYDVLLVHGVKTILAPPVLIRCALRKPLVVKVDATSELEQALSAESVSKMGVRDDSLLIRTWARLRAWMLRQADAVIAISSDVEHALKHVGVAPERIALLPNGIDMDRFRPGSTDRASLRSQLQLPSGALFVYVGRLSRAKGLLTLLEAWRRFVGSHADAHLVIVGAGDRSHDDCEAQLRAQATATPRIHFTGQIHDVLPYLHAADVFVLPSESEGFGLALVEAMACAVPCIATAVGVAPEVVNRSNGWLIAPRDDEQLYEALQAAMEQRAAWPQLGDAARGSVAQRFDLELVAAQQQRLMAELRHGDDARWTLEELQP